MADYAKVENGEVVEIGPEPDSWTNPDGSTTSTPEGVGTDPTVLKKAGYLPVEDRYEQGTPGAPQEYGPPTFEVLKTKVVRHFALVDIPPADETEVDGVFAQRLVNLEDRVAQIEMVSQHYKPMIDDWSQAGPLHDMDSRALFGAYQALRGDFLRLQEEVAALQASHPA